MKNWLRTAVLSLLLAASFACKGQSVITQYIYEVQVYTNIIHEISNRVWTVSNITIRTQNEITQKVNRVYNYYSTNFTVEAYIGTMIGTNIATNVENWVINDYSTNFVENITTNIYIDTVVGTNIATNIIVNISTNTYQTNYNYNIHNTYNINNITNYHYDFHYDIITNEYIDQVIGTNVVYDIHTTNQESYVALSNIEERTRIYSVNALNSANRSREYSLESLEYSLESKNYYGMVENASSNAMLFAYIAIESVNRLGNTNDTYIATNSMIYTDIYGTEYSNMSNLTINNVNGDLIAIANRQYDYIGGGGSSKNHYSTSYIMDIGGDPYRHPVQVVYNLSHVSESVDGMRVIYLPDRRRFPSPWDYIVPICLYWNCDNLISAQMNINTGVLQTNIVRNISSSPYNTPWPNGMYSSYGDTASTGWITMQGWTYNNNLPKLKTKFGLTPTTDIPCIMISRFPSLSDWKIMWEITDRTGYQFFR